MDELSLRDSESDSMKYYQYKSNFGRSVGALFKKSFLIKIRHPASIIEIILALVIWIVIYPCWLLARQDYDGQYDPRVYSTSIIPYRLIGFFSITRNSTFVVAPDCNNTRTLVSMINYTINLALDMFTAYMTSNSTDANMTYDWIIDAIDRLYPGLDDWINSNLNGTDFNFSDINFTNLFSNFTNGNLTIEDILNSLFNGTFPPFPITSTLLGIEDNHDYHQTLSQSYSTETFLEGFRKSIQSSSGISGDEVRRRIKEYLARYIHDYYIERNGYRPSEKVHYKDKRRSAKADGNEVDDEDEDNGYYPSTIEDFNVTDFRSNFVFDPVIVADVEEMKTMIYERLSNGAGVYWVNARDNISSLRSPIIQTFSQVFFWSPDLDLFDMVYRCISVMGGFPEAMVTLTNTSWQRFSTPPTEELYDLSIMIAIIVIFPVIISTMPDMQSLLEEKDSRVQTLSFLMGCSETAYFLVVFLMLIIVSIVPYLAMCLFLCYGFVMTSTSFSLMFVLSLLFVIAHVCFLMFLTTFMKKASMGRVTTVVFLVLTVFFAYIHYFYTLDSSNSSEAVKHVFSIIPLSCYQMVMMTLYSQSRTSLHAVGWSMLKSSDLLYQIWYGLMWLIIDSIVYFLLFLLFNLTNSRDFGSPLISWKELFHKAAWIRLFKSRKGGKSSVYGIYSDSINELMKVEGLSKTYNGYKVVKALTDVNFTIYQNEVIVVIGPNGAGKSTLINILAGAIEPTTGTLYLYGGAPTNRFKEIQKFLGVCFQDNVIINLLSIKEHFDLFGAFKNIPKDELYRVMNFYADTLQLKEMLKTRAGDLSGGQKRKLCISLSLLGDPPLVIMDEPTAGVDVQARQLIWKVIASLKHTTTIVTSHALEEAEAVSSRLFVVAGGRVPFAGTSTEFRKQFQCGYLLRVDTSSENVQNSPERNDVSDHEVDNNNNVDLSINDDSSSLESNYLDDELSLFREGESKIKVIDPEVMQRVLNLAKKFEPEAKLSDDRADTICMPVTKNIPKLICKLDEMKKELGVSAYSFSVEQLEDVLLKLIQLEEAKNE